MEVWMEQRDSWEDTFFAYCEHWEDAFFEYCVHCGCKNWESLPGRRAYCTAWYHDSIISFWSFTWQCGKFSGALAGPYPGPAPHCRRPLQDRHPSSESSRLYLHKARTSRRTPDPGRCWWPRCRGAGWSPANTQTIRIANKFQFRAKADSNWRIFHNGIPALFHCNIKISGLMV